MDVPAFCDEVVSDLAAQTVFRSPIQNVSSEALAEQLTVAVLDKLKHLELVRDGFQVDLRRERASHSSCSLYISPLFLFL